ncbi:MAG TPA: DUF5719 family protein [Propionibacteriaceae bacterium]|nr:DUF5719 family protein [Propionibacteriaceae bacterium]
MRHPLFRPAIAVAATLALVLVLGLLPSGRVAGAPIQVASARTLACVAGDPTTLTTTVLAGSADAFRHRLVGETSLGTTQTFLKAPVGKPMVLSGSASLGGLSQSTMPTGVYRGLWLAPCRAPAGEHWFPGVMSSTSERAAVELTNVDATQAVVDVTILGKDGRVTAPGARGLAVPGNSTRVVYLEPLLTTGDPLGIQVRASEGRIAATVRMSSDAGGDWSTGAATPAVTAVVPLVPGGEGARTLVVTNPGNRRATVTVEVSDKTSNFAPSGADTFDVNAESTVAIPLEGALKGAAVGLRLTSTQPVAAAVRAASDGDIAVIGSGSGLTGTVQMPVVEGAQLFVTNPGDAVATVTLVTRTAEGGVVDTSRTQVEPGRSLPLPLTGDRTATFELSADRPDVRGAMWVGRTATQVGLAVAVLGGGSAGPASYDPTLEPGLSR